MGTWDQVHNGVAKVAFRKMLFNGARQNFGDLHVTGTLTSTGTHLHGDGTSRSWTPAAKRSWSSATPPATARGLPDVVRNRAAAGSTVYGERRITPFASRVPKNALRDNMRYTLGSS